MSKRYAMFVDTPLCVSCKACVLACKAENRVPDGFSRDWLMEEVYGEFPHLSAENRSERCNHCSNPLCVSACPTGASHVNEGGTVLVTHDKCTGCKACIAACPYNARYTHPDGYVDKCTFCLHRVERGQQPASSRRAFHLDQRLEPVQLPATRCGAVGLPSPCHALAPRASAQWPRRPPRPRRHRAAPTP